MSDHQGLPVAGYVPQSDKKVERVNNNKWLEERLLRVVEEHGESMDYSCDPRWLSVARTHFEQGFMALNRAVFKPQRIRLPEDAR